MEPLAYPQIARRRWWLIVGLVLAAVLIVYLMTPDRIVDHYEATHVLLVEGDRESGGGDSSAANPEVVALWAKDDEVLSAAAAELGLGLDTQRLSRDLTVDTERAVDTVAITAEADDPDFAALMANTVAAETVTFLVDRETARQEAIAEELNTRETQLRERIAELDATIDKNPPDVETITAERDALIRQLGEVLEEQDVDTQAVRYTSVEVPERGSKQERPLGTRTREQRMVLAGLVAAVLGFGLAIMLDRSDTRLRTKRSAEEHFGLPVIAEVVAFPIWSRHRRLAVARQPESAVAESFRTLRSALMLLGPVQGTARRHNPPGDPPATNGERSHPPADVIMITSAGTDDGKTTTVANLAATYAESGQSVLVLSFDLKRSKVRASKDKRHPGVSDYLAASSPPPLETLRPRHASAGCTGRGKWPRQPPARRAVRGPATAARRGPVDRRRGRPRHRPVALVEHRSGAGDDGGPRGRAVPRGTLDGGGGGAGRRPPRPARRPCPRRRARRRGRPDGVGVLRVLQPAPRSAGGGGGDGERRGRRGGTARRRRPAHPHRGLRRRGRPGRRLSEAEAARR